MNNLNSAFSDSQINQVQKYVHPHGDAPKGKVLMVVSSPAVSEQTGWPVGFWGAELTHPMLTFSEAGYESDIVSTEGGRVIMDAYSNPRDESGYSAHDVITLGYLQKPEFNAILETTKAIRDVNPDQYDAIFLVGGQGPMYTFRNNKELENLFVAFYESGRPSAAVCHATTILLDAKLANGSLLVKGKTWTGFANSEEDIADEAVGMKIQPYRIETKAGKIDGTRFVVADPFSAHAVRDGNLITGQQQNSGSEAAKMVIELLESDPQL